MTMSFGFDRAQADHDAQEPPVEDDCDACAGSGVVTVQIGHYLEAVTSKRRRWYGPNIEVPCPICTERD